VGLPGRAEEVAEAVLWLHSPGASFVVAVALPVDGGFTAHRSPSWRAAAMPFGSEGTPGHPGRWPVDLDDRLDLIAFASSPAQAKDAVRV